PRPGPDPSRAGSRPPCRRRRSPLRGRSCSPSSPRRCGRGAPSRPWPRWLPLPCLARPLWLVRAGHGRRLLLGLHLSLLAAARPLVGGRLLVALRAFDLLARGPLSLRLGLLPHL